MRENRTSGTVRGAPGNRRSYRENCPNQRALIEFMKFTVSDLQLMRHMVLSANAKELSLKI